MQIKDATPETYVPPLEVQCEIVARIATERAIVHGGRKLIRLYEEKVKKVIQRVWEGKFYCQIW
jgi:type I restriction enzyme M protein